VLKAVAMVMMGLLECRWSAPTSRPASSRMGLRHSGTVRRQSVFVVVAMGGVRLCRDHAQPWSKRGIRASIVNAKLSGLMPDLAGLGRRRPARSAAARPLGSLLGILPGGRRGDRRAFRGLYVSRRRMGEGTRRCFGRGRDRRRCGRRKAPTNAASQTSFIPLLTLRHPAPNGRGWR